MRKREGERIKLERKREGETQIRRGREREGGTEKDGAGEREILYTYVIEGGRK